MPTLVRLWTKTHPDLTQKMEGQIVKKKKKRFKDRNDFLQYPDRK